MTVIDLHPDELLDRARRGALTDDEHAHLHEHLAHCMTCRFELQLQHDFAAEARLFSETDGLSALVSGALKAATIVPAKAAPPPPRRARRWALLLAATLLLATGIATAQTGLLEQVFRFAGVRTETVLGARPASHRPAHRAAIAKAPPRPVEAPVATKDGETSATDAQVAETVDAPAPTSVVRGARHLPRSPAPRAREAARVEQSGRRAHSTVPVQSSPAVTVIPMPMPLMTPAPAITPQPRAPEAIVPAAPAPTPPAEVAVAESSQTLFERANSLRRSGRAHEASAAYRALAERFPRSAEARLALVLMARLELDHGDPSAALAGFDAYLSSRDGVLREQALSGRALALGRLAQHPAECAALRDLLAAYPSSTYASVAKRRCLEAQ